jgi:outer membrane protein TolC
VTGVQTCALPISFDEQKAIDVALISRPDVLTAYAKLRDAKRDVEIAINNFLPQLDLVLLAVVPSDKSPNRKPLDIEIPQTRRSARVAFDYQLDQTNNRDAYRNRVIAAAKSQRDLDEFLDNVRLDVRSSYRSLVQSRRSYEIQRSSVALATRRTRLAQFEQREGLASTRDVLDAEDALRTSKNAMTAAMVSYTNTRLNFLAGVGMIDVDAQGKFHERSEPTTTDRLSNFR